MGMQPPAGQKFVPVKGNSKFSDSFPTLFELSGSTPP